MSRTCFPDVHCRCRTLNLPSSVTRSIDMTPITCCMYIRNMAMLVFAESNQAVSYSQGMKFICVIKRFAIE